MAHSRTARKAVRQNVAHRAVNRWRLQTMRDAIKDFRLRITSGSVDEAREAFRVACAVVDRTAQKGVIHRNQAARRKSRMNSALKAKALAKG